MAFATVKYCLGAGVKGELNRIVPTKWSQPATPFITDWRRWAGCTLTQTTLTGPTLRYLFNAPGDRTSTRLFPQVFWHMRGWKTKLKDDFGVFLRGEPPQCDEGESLALAEPKKGPFFSLTVKRKINVASSSASPSCSFSLDTGHRISADDRGSNTSCCSLNVLTLLSPATASCTGANSCEGDGNASNAHHASKGGRVRVEGKRDGSVDPRIEMPLASPAGSRAGAVSPKTHTAVAGAQQEAADEAHASLRPVFHAEELCESKLKNSRKRKSLGRRVRGVFSWCTFSGAGKDTVADKGR